MFARPRCLIVTFAILTSLLSSPTLSQAPAIDPPVPIGGAEDLVLAAGDQTGPWVAPGGLGYLAVWSDARSTVPRADVETETGRDIYAMRLDAAGEPIDTAPFPVVEDFGHQRFPRAAWNGSSWLVIWHDQKPSGSYHAQHVYGMRIAGDGSRLDAEPFLIVDYSSSSSLHLDLTAQGSDWLVVAQGTSSGETDILGVRVASEGSLLDDPPVVLVPSTYYLRSRISVHAAGGEYLLVYDDNPDLVGHRFTSDLVSIGTFDLPGTKLASNGDGYYVAWYSDASFHYVGSPMALDGTLDTPSGVPITSEANNGYMVTWAGTQWWFMWLQPVEEIKLARIDATGNVLDPAGVPLDANAPDQIHDPHVAGGTDGSAQVVWTQFDAQGLMPNDVHAANVAPSGAPLPGVEISTAVASQLLPELVRGPGDFVAAYQERHSGTRRLLLRRLDDLGHPVDTDPVMIAAGADIGSHAIDWNGSAYLVVWTEDERIYGRRYDASLVALDDAPFEIMEGVSPDVAAVDDTFLVVAAQQVTSIHFYYPYAIRVGGDGTLLDAQEFRIGQYFTRSPRVTEIAGKWLAIWQRNYSHDDRRADVNAAWIRPDGTFDPYFVVDYGGFEPEIAYSGARALITFRQGTLAAADQDVAARMMLPDGSMPETTFLVSDAVDKQRSPHVAWDGRHFFVAWEDRREAEAFFDERSDIYAARITEDGMLVDPDAFPLADGSSPSVQPNVVSADGDTLVAGALFDSSARSSAYRVSTFHLAGGATSPPDASFVSEKTDGCLPMDVAFTDLSVGGADAWEWSFGDGGSSSDQNPLHTYAESGVYTVYMTARGPGGADTEIQENLVRVSGGIVADFSSSVVSGCAPLEVAFEDLSTGYPSAWVWNFGDDAFSNEQNPTHVYEYPGTHSVELTASGCGSSTETKIAFIEIDGMCPNTALAEGETPIYGTMTNDYTWTHENDGYNQVLQEESFGGGPNVSTRMEHRWHFTVPAGTSVDFHADVLPYASYFEKLAFEYSTDGQSFVPLATIEDYEVREVDAPLPSSVAGGSLTIRLLDLDRDAGDDFRNTININHLRVDASDAPPAHDCEAVTGVAFTSDERMEWLATASSTHYDVVRGDVAALQAKAGIGDGACRAEDVASTELVDADVPIAGRAFYYVIRGDASAVPVGTYDNPPGTASVNEGRDDEAGTSGGSRCADRP